MKSRAPCALFRRDRQHPRTDSGHRHRCPPTVFIEGAEYRSLFWLVRQDFGCGEPERAEPRRALEPRLVA
jgi:hypothetical protein